MKLQEVPVALESPVPKRLNKNAWPTMVVIKETEWIAYPFYVYRLFRPVRPQTLLTPGNPIHLILPIQTKE